MKCEVLIPEIYVWMTEGYDDRGKLFKRYVEGYLKKSYPHLKLIKIVGMKAICERRALVETGKKTDQKTKDHHKKRRVKS